MNINAHRQAVVRTLIKSLYAEWTSSQHDSLAYSPLEESEEDEEEEHTRGCTTCVATSLFFVDSMSEMVTTWSNYGPLWMGLWIDSPVWLHDAENEVSRRKGGDYHGMTLFPRWLAEVLNKECQLGIREEDIYD